MVDFRLEKNEIIFAILIAVAGFIISWHPVINYFNSISPLLGLGIKYLVLFVFVAFILRLFGLRVGGLKLDGSLNNVIGSLMIIFAFLIVINFVNSPLAQIYYDNGGIQDSNTLSPMLMISEDSFVWYSFYYSGVQNVELLRVLTYVVTPFVLALIGGLLVSGRRFNQVLGKV